MTQISARKFYLVISLQNIIVKFLTTNNKSLLPKTKLHTLKLLFSQQLALLLNDFKASWEKVDLEIWINKSEKHAIIAWQLFLHTSNLYAGPRKKLSIA